MLRAIKMFLTITLKNVSSKCLNQPNTNIFVIVEKKPKNSPIAFASLSTAQEEHPSWANRKTVYASDQMGFSCHHNIMY